MRAEKMQFSVIYEEPIYLFIYESKTTSYMDTSLFVLPASCLQGMQSARCKVLEKC